VDAVDARDRERIARLDVGIGRRGDDEVRIAVVDVDLDAEAVHDGRLGRVELVRAVDGRDAAGCRGEVQRLVVLEHVETGHIDAERCRFVGVLDGAS
jgi:hypothetical protein